MYYNVVTFILASTIINDWTDRMVAVELSDYFAQVGTYFKDLKGSE